MLLPNLTNSNRQSFFFYTYNIDINLRFYKMFIKITGIDSIQRRFPNFRDADR